MAKRKSRCQQCGARDDDVGLISKRGLCRFCSIANQLDNAQQLADKQGPAYNLWLKRQREGYRRMLGEGE